MSKFLDQTKIDGLVNQMTSSYIRIIVEKNCGYQFMFLLNNDALLSDLYREVELIYGYMNVPLNLYYGKNYLRGAASNENVVNNAENEAQKTNDAPNNIRCRKCIQNETYDGGDKVFIPKSTLKLKDYVNEIKLAPCTNLPAKVCYKFYLDVCEKH